MMSYLTNIVFTMMGHTVLTPQLLKKQHLQNKQQQTTKSTTTPILHLPHLMIVGKDVKIGVVGVVVCFEGVAF